MSDETKRNLPLRPSTPADSEAIHRLWYRSVKATHHFLSPEDVEAISAEVRDQYIPSAEFTLAVDGERILGWLGMTEATIDALFVDPDAFRMGVGRALIAFARSTTSKPLTLDVNEDNPGAVAFYESMGFEVTGRSELDNEGRPFPYLHMREALSALQAATHPSGKM